jgi:predicted metalloprotease with PDZ domain
MICTELRRKGLATGFRLGETEGARKITIISASSPNKQAGLEDADLKVS